MTYEVTVLGIPVTSHVDGHLQSTLWLTPTVK